MTGMHHHAGPAHCLFECRYKRLILLFTHCELSWWPSGTALHPGDCGWDHGTRLVSLARPCGISLPPLSFIHVPSQFLMKLRGASGQPGHYAPVDLGALWGDGSSVMVNGGRWGPFLLQL